jgi:TonB family protein
MHKNRVGNSFFMILPLCLSLVSFSFTQDGDTPSPVSLQVNNRPLRFVLQEIANQTGASFVFDDGLVDGKIISCRFHREPIDQALQEVLAQTSLSYKVLSDFTVVLFSDKNKNVKKYHADKPMTPPVLQENIEPSYPPLAQTEGMEGTVTMNLLVSESGDVQKVEITRSSGYRILDNAASVFARKLKFDPAQQGDQPIGAWISWVLDYHLLAQEYLPIRYIQKIKRLRGQAEAKGDGNCIHLCKEIIDTHLEFVEYIHEKKPGLNYNQYIRELVYDDIFEEWKSIWDDLPLHFLVFHDFIRRYPNSSSIQTAESLLFHYVKKTLNSLDYISNNHKQERKKRFLTHVSLLLEKVYPDTFSQVVIEEVK